MRQRQQHVERAAGQVDPEIADGLGRGPREGADQRDGERDAGSGGHEVLGGERRHLGEIAHRALAAVVLPVGVGGEADGGIEGEVRGDRRHARRIERQHRLEALQRVDQQEARGIEQQHGDRIGEPVLLARLVDAGEPDRGRASTGRKTGDRNVRSPSNTRAMKRPSGTTSAVSTTK